MIRLARLLGRTLAVASFFLFAPVHVAWAATKDAGTAAVRAALAYRGVRYRWGGLSSRGVDCSGLAVLTYRRLGVALPRTAGAQSRYGMRVALGAFRPGDLLFFRTKRGRVGHVGIYVGNDRMLHAPRTGSRVKVVALNGYWRGRITAARRVVRPAARRLEKGTSFATR